MTKLLFRSININLIDVGLLFYWGMVIIRIMENTKYLPNKY